MKITLVLAAAVLMMSGCVSSTRSYDANGRLLGYCEAERAFFLGNAGATCIGSSNPKDQGESVPLDSGSVKRMVDSMIEAARLPERQEARISERQKAQAQHDASIKCPEGQTAVYGSCYPNHLK